MSNFLTLSDRLISMLGSLFSWLFIRSGPLSYGADMCHLRTQSTKLSGSNPNQKHLHEKCSMGYN